jgi:hypothetical protein
MTWLCRCEITSQRTLINIQTWKRLGRRIIISPIYTLSRLALGFLRCDYALSFEDKSLTSCASRSRLNAIEVATSVALEA